MSSGQKFNPLKLAPTVNLFAAVKANDIMRVEKMLENGTNPDIQDDLGATPLMHAINGGLGDMVRLLLYYGADVNIEGPNGWFPLLFAVERGEHNILGDLLLVDEIKVNKALPNGATALHIAAQENDPLAAELLLIRGADVNAMTVAGNTPFMILAHSDPAQNLSEIKRVLQEAMAESANSVVAAAAKPNLYPKNMKHKKEGGRRTKRRRHNKRKTRRHAK